MARLFQKIFLVLWKNAIIRKRHWILTLFEIVIPTLLFLTLASVFPLNYYESPGNFFPAYKPSEVLTSSDLFNYDTHIYYTPLNNFTKKIMKAVEDELLKHQELEQYGYQAKIIGVEDEKAIILEYQKAAPNMKIIGLIFEYQNDSTMPKLLKYRIRLGKTMNIDSMFSEFAVEGPDHLSDQYINSGIASLQLAVDRAFITLVRIEASSRNVDFQQLVQKFPYPPYRMGANKILSTLLAILTVISFMLLCPAILKRIVEEKQTGVKELMKLMGLKSWMLWLGWLLNALFVNIFSISVIVICLKAQMTENLPVIVKTDGTILWVFYLLYCMASVFLLFAVSAFFSRPTLAMTFGLFIWFMSYFILAPFTESMNLNFFFKILVCLVPNGALSQGLLIVSSYETRGMGLQWQYISTPPTGSSDDLSMADVFIAFSFSAFIYMLVTYYVDSVMPGKYGIAKPWYFIFQLCIPNGNSIESTPVISSVGKNYETAPTNLKPGIQIKNLSKLYHSFRKSGRKLAVNGINLDIYSGQITALLGHNGAGKTTTMSIIAGMFSPSSGTVTVGGYDIRKNLDDVRESLGLCPQHNMLFIDLTVKEHLVFFAMLKGSSFKSAQTEAENLLRKLNLVEKMNKLPAALSGGMKRKLSLGISLVGNAKVLLLDEPTSGMDPEVRRQMWDLLLSMRGERTILLTTHFMEEADVLGDRIAIMDHGKVKCYGTSIFLKKLYGTGYQLSIIKGNSCNEGRVWEEVQKCIPDAAIKNLNGPVLSFTLPSEQTSSFPMLFDSLETKRDILGINGIGVSVTTLEEVFLNVGKESEEETAELGSTKSEASDETQRLHSSTEALNVRKLKGLKLVHQQFKALLVSRIRFSLKVWITSLVKMLLPIILTIITVVNSVKMSSDNEIPSHTFTLDDYGKTEVFSHSDPLCKNDLLDLYREEISSTKSTLNIVGSENITSALLKEGIDNIMKLREKIIVAGDFNCTSEFITANALYSNVALHGFPISVNIMSNTLLHFYNKTYSTLFSFQPFHYEERKFSISEGKVTLLWMSLIPMGVLCLVANFISFPLLERVSKARHLQFMAGVKPLLYWLTTFVWDYLQYFMICVVMLMCVLIFDTQGVFTHVEELGVFFMVLLLYGCSGIPFSYCFSYLRQTVASGYNLLVTLNMLVGLIVTTITYILSLSSEYDQTRNIIEGVFRFLPHFALTNSLLKYSLIVVRRTNCLLAQEKNCTSAYVYFGKSAKSSFLGYKNPDITLDVLFLLVDVIIYFFILLCLDYGMMKKLYAMILRQIFKGEITRAPLDSDVADEEIRIQQQIKGLSQQDQGIDVRDTLLVDSLVKKFGRFPAVKGISFGVRAGECFGLLGVNGAGKTTSFGMLTGDLIPTSGDASISNNKLSKDTIKYCSNIGYCPQFDALSDHLTGQELIKMYAQLRGVPQTVLTNEVNRWLHLLGLKEYRNKCCGTYSGGNKRKLSTAIALVGDPAVVFLDEPTSGVDPVSRRNLWDVLGKIRKTGQAVVLTSHSMEECDVLCDRLAIMVAGQFMCLGNSQYLKQKFGQGFTIMIKLRVTNLEQDDMNLLKTVVQEKFENCCTLKDEHLGLLHYHINRVDMSWKTLFAIMEQLKREYSIVEDYTISETTLEQVFLSFAKMQSSSAVQDVPDVAEV